MFSRECKGGSVRLTGWPTIAGWVRAWSYVGGGPCGYSWACPGIMYGEAPGSPGTTVINCFSEDM